eukprot:14347422-Alexandrium_andersonii.AAC.1
MHVCECLCVCVLVCARVPACASLVWAELHCALRRLHRAPMRHAATTMRAFLSFRLCRRPLPVASVAVAVAWPPVSWWP